MFQSDFRNGVSVLNRMLNHAAVERERTLECLDHRRSPQDDNHSYGVELDVAGARRTYVGDEHVWLWYRGTGVGPYPCMSALQALERVCDDLVQGDVPLAALVAILLEDCENLAMLGLVVGLLVRHLEHADRLLDRFLTEPLIWDLEFTRVVSEQSGLAAAADGVTAPERRGWSLRETAMMMVLQADNQRADELRLLGQGLIETARRLMEEEFGDTDDTEIQEQLATVRGWASNLDRRNYRAQQVEGGLEIQSTPPDDVVEALQARNAESARTHEVMRLNVRYYVNPKNGKNDAVDAADLAADLDVARELLENPPEHALSGHWDAPAAVAAAALMAHIVNGVVLPADALRLAAETLLSIGEGTAAPRPYEYEETYFEQGADRVAAQALPLLLLPTAAPLRAQVDGDDSSTTYHRATAAAGTLARSVAHEVRLHFARGMDHVWRAACAPEDGICRHHEAAFQLTIETMRDCLLGDWDQESGRPKAVPLDDPVADSLAAATDTSIYAGRLDAAIRALGPAASASICASTPARELLAVLLAAHRRSLLASEPDMDSRGTHALIAARALLAVASTGEDALLFQHIDAYADNAPLLASFLDALSAAAEESAEGAATARRIWPTVITHVIALQNAGHSPFTGHRTYRSALASLLPNPAPEVAYLYREVQGEPIVWWEPLAWQSTVAQWLPLARGQAACVDQLIGFIRPLPTGDQARVGIPWVAELVLANPAEVATRTFLLASWLIELRQAVAATDITADWQRVIDALVVAGVSRLAPYSE
ncbi:hypothetical protein [Kitasatospora sp. NE20-6]|uniref:hypothetical protein n=1 Tax=Kitasatospora sp. NE20-6 TaxID=2859066 RepID=UPI0038B29CE1